MPADCFAARGERAAWCRRGVAEGSYALACFIFRFLRRPLLEQWLFALDDLHQVTEERLYDQLMEEFPSWIREASAKGIIG
ncbi:VWA domain-containing protein [Pseudomonas aeruginosa]|uniref:VWA domain-containing protein n=1 Tax=Pseudomonas aeruginosa TaxID=287 RepID=UPI001F18E4BE|nr:VWA domain-containing protein [Pseudomonas aeruginosa]MCG0501259.1 VWA domain-containing protein [Pseudomonas aeruginosa]